MPTGPGAVAVSTPWMDPGGGQRLTKASLVLGFPDETQTLLSLWVHGGSVGPSSPRGLRAHSVELEGAAVIPCVCPVCVSG